MEEMEKDAEVPLPARRLKVGIVYNLKHGVQADAPDAEAELDHISTVEAIGDALAAGGYETALLEADEKLVDKLAADRPDVVFNIAEGLHGRGREAQVPAMLSFLGIPYTGSDETTLCIALDKMLTKQLLAPHRVRTPRAAGRGKRENAARKNAYLSGYRQTKLRRLQQGHFRCEHRLVQGGARRAA